jgi:hypothetical protein
MRSKKKQDQLSKKRMVFQAWFVLAWIIIIPMKMFTIKGQYVLVTQIALGIFLAFLIYQLYRLYMAIKEASED